MLNFIMNFKTFILVLNSEVWHVIICIYREVTFYFRVRNIHVLIQQKNENEICSKLCNTYVQVWESLASWGREIGTIQNSLCVLLLWDQYMQCSVQTHSLCATVLALIVLPSEDKAAGELQTWSLDYTE